MLNLPLLVESDELEPLLGQEKILILDVSPRDNYLAGHIPGAIHVIPGSLVCGIKPATGKLPSIEQLTDLFSRLGLTAEHHVVAYDDEGGGWAGRLIWTLDVLGHKKYSYLNGGIHAWRNEGHPMESLVNEGQPVVYQVNINQQPIAEVDDILASLDQQQVMVWDTRSRDEYEGKKVLALRGGHIPGAVNLDWLELMDNTRNLRLKNLDELQATLNSLGLTKDKPVITHCQTHHRSGLSYLVGKLLSYDIRGYHGSWSEWGNREDTPIG